MSDASGERSLEAPASGPSIRTRVMLLAAAVLLPAAIALAWRLAEEIQQSRDDALLTVSVLRDDGADQVAGLLEHAMRLLARVARDPSLQGLAAGNCGAAMRTVPLLQPEFSRLELVDASGTVVCKARRDEPEALAARVVTPSASDSATQAVRGELAVDPTTGHAVYTITQPLPGPESAPHSELRLILDLRELGLDIARNTSDGAVVSVIDRSGTVLVRTIEPDKFVGKQFHDSTGGRDTGTIETRGGDGVERLYAFKSIPATGWRVFAGLPRERVYAKYEHAVRRTAAVGVIVLLVAFGLAWRLASGIVVPVASLQSAVRRVALGDPAEHVTVSGPPELQRVAEDFNRMVDALASSQSRLQALFETMSEAVVTIDEAQRIVMANQAAATLFHCPTAELVGSNLDRWIPARFRDAHRAEVERFRASGSGPRDMGHRPELSALRSDGEEIPIEASISFIVTGGQRFCTAVLRDVGDRRKAMAELAASRALLAAALKNMSDAVVILDAEGRFLAVNDAFAAFYRLRPDHPPFATVQELAAQLDVRFEDGRPAPAGECAGTQAIAGGSGNEMLYRLRRIDGTETWIGSYNFAPIHRDDGTISGAVVTARDVTAALAAQRELERSHEALRRLVGALDRSQDDERRRISRELHDDLQQTLAAIGIEASAVLRQMPPSAASLGPGLERIETLSRSALRSTRRIIADLRPQVLEELGLEAALRNMADVLSRRHALHCEVHVDEDLDTQALPALLASCLYRVAQEALNNVVKHAGAAGVLISLEKIGDSAIRLTVRDDGRGLPPDAGRKPRTFGLLGMSERIHALAGRLRVESEPGGGAIVEAELPLDSPFGPDKKW